VKNAHTVAIQACLSEPTASPAYSNVCSPGAPELAFVVKIDYCQILSMVYTETGTTTGVNNDWHTGTNTAYAASTDTPSVPIYTMNIFYPIKSVTFEDFVQSPACAYTTTYVAYIMEVTTLNVPATWATATIHTNAAWPWASIALDSGLTKLFLNPTLAIEKKKYLVQIRGTVMNKKLCADGVTAAPCI
jgi:hypothetical protein